MRRFAILALMAAAGLAQAQEISHTTQPTVIHKTDPKYTDQALEDKVEGVVVLAFMVGTDGVAKDIRVVRGLGDGLDEKAVECLQSWRFNPATRFGEAIEVKAQAEINFRLPPK